MPKREGVISLRSTVIKVTGMGARGPERKVTYVKRANKGSRTPISIIILPLIEKKFFIFHFVSHVDK
jgi:hypothetical protein